ncbi:MAG TPA: sensor domain-containing phosphodiesterase [Ruminiclostridium sp.]|nr:sensor domain-containing phosphodiesterase [Ruminiclostridium sp.]
MEYPIVFGILLVATGGSSVACGLYAIQNNIKTPVNKVFLALGCAMLLWCLGLAITVVAANEEICAFGRRLAPIGWGIICSILLHFILLLTQKNNLLKKWWLYPLLYLPSAVTIFAYTYLPLIHLNQDHLIRNELGWLNISITDAWDWFYYGYCFLFVAIAIVIVYLWAKNSASKNIKKQVKLLIISLLVASVFGSLTDILPVFLKIRIPQFSPVFVLFPIAAISYSVKYYGFLRPEAENQNELILNESAYTNVYRYISLIFAAGSVLNLVILFLPYYKEAFFPSALLFDGALIAITAFIFLINRVKLVDSIKEMLLAVGLSFIIPSVTLWFVCSGSITIWAFVFLLIIICLLFNRRILLITVIVSSILTQLLTWAAVPSVSLEVNGADYIFRIGLIGFAAILSFYVHKIYVQRLKENARQISMQMLVAETSRDFVSVNEQNFSDKVYSMLKRCGGFIQSDRAYVALLDPDTKHAYYFLEWPANSVPAHGNVFKEPASGMQSMLLKQFEFHNVVKLHDTALLPLAEKLKNQLMSCDIRALLALPVKNQDTVTGFLAFTAARPIIGWRSEPFTYLEVISNIIADSIIKIDAEKEIKFIAYHDQLTLLPNRILFKDRLEQAIRRAERTEKMIGVVFLDLDSFKSVNDTMGHELGDQLLFKAGRILSRSIRNYDTIARFGGDEFVILLNDITSTKDIIKIMDKIIDTLRRPVLLNEQEFFISASAGVALYPQDGADVETLIKSADIAMYDAKAQGKNQYLLCSWAVKDQAPEE